MQQFLIRRGLYVVLMLVMVSIVGFVVINLPPGDFMDAYLARMQSSGTEVDRETADNLRRNYGLDKPLYVRYLIWFSGVVRGDFGWSFDHQIPVIRVMRATLLDELRKQYVITARAKGARDIHLILKYPARVALNPIVSTVGWLLPEIISGAAIVLVVLSLPTTGQLLLRALRTQDMYLAGSLIAVAVLASVRRRARRGADRRGEADPGLVGAVHDHRGSGRARPADRQRAAHAPRGRQTISSHATYL